MLKVQRLNCKSKIPITLIANIDAIVFFRSPNQSVTKDGKPTREIMAILSKAAENLNSACFRSPALSQFRLSCSPFPRRRAFPVMEGTKERIGIFVAQQVCRLVQLER